MNTPATDSSASELYLIAHKVRGQPAFDVAQRFCTSTDKPCQPACGCWDGSACQMRDEWIIPTSGHRAYPYFHQPLIEIVQDDLLTSEPPADLPDHYPERIAPKASPKAGRDILASLGLLKPAEPIRRI